MSSVVSGRVVPWSPSKVEPIDFPGADSPGFFTMGLQPKTRELQTRLPIWSVGLRWVIYEYYDWIPPSSPMPAPGCETEHLESVELPLAEAWLAPDFGVHMERHAAALAQGLSAGGENDLPTERILIDRHLKRMLEIRDVDLLGIADALSRQDDYLSLCASCLQNARQEVDGTMFLLRQMGLGLPVLSAWVPLGRGSYCGHALEIEEQLPGTISVGVAGRLLGDLVETGVPELDARRITEVGTWPMELNDHWGSTWSTKILLEPDHVEIGLRIR